MPGIYINDGGGTSSALGNALGGLATALGPETAAKAQLTRLQAEEADRQNWLLSTRQRGVLGIPGVTAATSSDPTAPSAATVPSAVAALSQPSTAPGTRDQTASFSPFNQVLAGSYANDPSMANLTTGINLGRTAALGPGQDYGTQTEVAKANMLPHETSLGVTRTTPRPDLGAAPAGVAPKVEYGGSPVEQEVQSATAKDALADQKAGAQANDAIAQLAALQALRRRVVQGHFTPGDVIYDEAAKKADAFFGTGVFTRLNDRQDIMNTIRARMKAITAATRAAYAGDPALRGLSQKLDDSLPDPESDQFDNSVGALTQTLNATVDDANAANEFLKNPGNPRAADDYRSGKLARHAAAAAAAAQALKPSGNEGETPAPASGETKPPAAPAPPGKHWIWNPKTGRTEPQ